MSVTVFKDNIKCTISEFTTNLILAEWDNGKTWVNSDFLYDQYKKPGISEDRFCEGFVDFELFRSYEKFLGWGDADSLDQIRYFKEQNPKLKEFFDCFYVHCQ